MKLHIYILSLSILFASTASAVQPAPPSPPGSPIPYKPWHLQDQKKIEGVFKGNQDKRYYFSDVVTNVSRELVSPHIDYESDNVSVFDKIVLLEHIDKTEQERTRIKKLNRFLDRNYKTQILPEEAYSTSHLPKPFYLNELKVWAFDAVKNSDLTTLRSLLNSYNLLEIKNKSGMGLLSYALLHNNNRIARFLIRRGANINEKDKSNNTPINIAAHNNNEVMVSILAKSGCDVHHKNNAGKSAKDYAKMNDNLHMHKYLQGMK